MAEIYFRDDDPGSKHRGARTVPPVPSQNPTAMGRPHPRLPGFNVLYEPVWDLTDAVISELVARPALPASDRGLEDSSRIEQLAVAQRANGQLGSILRTWAQMHQAAWARRGVLVPVRVEIADLHPTHRHRGRSRQRCGHEVVVEAAGEPWNLRVRTRLLTLDDTVAELTDLGLRPQRLCLPPAVLTRLVDLDDGRSLSRTATAGRALALTTRAEGPVSRSTALLLAALGFEEVRSCMFGGPYWPLEVASLEAFPASFRCPPTSPPTRRTR